jgi:hypothetical protein
MTESVDWRKAFAAFGALLGEPAEAVAAALGEAAPSPSQPSASRAARARAVASVVTRVLADLESARLR